MVEDGPVRLRDTRVQQCHVVPEHSTDGRGLEQLGAVDEIDTQTVRIVEHVGFEIESRGQKVAAERLAASGAHCTVRYLYDCPVPSFKIAEDRSDENWRAWKE